MAKPKSEKLGRPRGKSLGQQEHERDQDMNFAQRALSWRPTGLFDNSSQGGESFKFDLNRFRVWPFNSSENDTSNASTDGGSGEVPADFSTTQEIGTQPGTAEKRDSWPLLRPGSVEAEPSSRQANELTPQPRPVRSQRIPSLHIEIADIDESVDPCETRSDSKTAHHMSDKSQSNLLSHIMPKFSSLLTPSNDQTDEETSSAADPTHEAPRAEQQAAASQSRPNRDEQNSARLHSDEMVDYLDVLDPAVSVFNTLHDYGNSAMLPNLPWLYNRRPTLRLNQVISSSEREQREEVHSPELPSPTSPIKRHNSDGANSLGSISPSLKPVAACEPYTGQADDVKPERQLSIDLSMEQEAARTSDSVNHIDNSFESTHIVDEKDVKIRQNTDDPHTERYWQMDKEERCELEAHVRYLLTRKSKTKRMIRGFWNFVRTPMGFILTTYIFLIASWGIVIFLFLVNWVNVEPYHRRRVWIEVCDQVLCALFVLRGVGFAPFRIVDTYHMAHIAHFHFLTYKRRKLLNLPKLANENELPRYTSEMIENALKESSVVQDHAHRGDAPGETSVNIDMELQYPLRDLESIGVKNAYHVRTKPYHFEQLLQPLPGQPRTVQYSVEEIEKARLKRVPSIRSVIDKETHEVSVLTPSEQAQLQHHQHCFHSSHTFYRYRETATHRPFPLWLMMTIVILLDVYSMLQACLAGTTWGIRYEHRSTALQASIISCSLSCNAIAGILIWQGGARTRKTEVVERRVKLAIEEQAIARMDRKRRKAAKLAQQNRLRTDNVSKHNANNEDHYVPGVCSVHDLSADISVQPISQLHD